MIKFVQEIEERIANLVLGREGSCMVFAAQHGERAAHELGENLSRVEKWFVFTAQGERRKPQIPQISREITPVFRRAGFQGFVVIAEKLRSASGTNGAAAFVLEVSDPPIHSLPQSVPKRLQALRKAMGTVDGEATHPPPAPSMPARVNEDHLPARSGQSVDIAFLAPAMPVCGKAMEENEGRAGAFDLESNFGSVRGYGVMLHSDVLSATDFGKMPAASVEQTRLLGWIIAR